MSMEIAVWAACALALPHDLPVPENWQASSDSIWLFQEGDWQVALQSFSSIEPSNPVKANLPNAKILTLVSLEPIDAPESGYSFLNDVAANIAKKCSGALLEGPMGIVKLDSQGEEVR